MVLSQGEVFEAHPKKAKVNIQEVDVVKYARRNQVISTPRLSSMYTYAITLRKQYLAYLNSKALNLVTVCNALSWQYI